MRTKDFLHTIYFLSLWSAVCGLWAVPAFASENWLEGANGYARGLDQAKLSGKPLILYFYTDWCPYCRKFENNILADAAVKKNLESFIRVQVNPDDGSRENELARQYRVSGYPTVLFARASDLQGAEAAGRAIRAPADFIQATNRYLKKIPAAEVSQTVDSPKSSGLSEQVPEAVVADHVLHLKNGRKAEGTLVSESAKGLTLAMDGLGEVYFSKSEYTKLEKIKE